jgi:hypothetical protein
MAIRDRLAEVPCEGRACELLARERGEAERSLAQIQAELDAARRTVQRGDRLLASDDCEARGRQCEAAALADAEAQLEVARQQHRLDARNLLVHCREHALAAAPEYPRPFSLAWTAFGCALVELVLATVAFSEDLEKQRAFSLSLISLGVNLGLPAILAYLLVRRSSAGPGAIRAGLGGLLVIAANAVIAYVRTAPVAAIDRDSLIASAGIAIVFAGIMSGIAAWVGRKFWKSLAHAGREYGQLEQAFQRSLEQYVRLRSAAR